MPAAEPFDDLPLWALMVATALVVLASIELGYRMGKRRRHRFPDEREAPVGAIVAASLGLLGFMLAFTFGLAATRFDARRLLVVEEANAIGTAYLRAGLLPDGRGAAVRRLLAEYVDLRLEVIRTGDVDRGMQRSDQLHAALWKEAEAMGLAQPRSIAVGLFIEALNDTIDIHSKRVLVGIRSRLPNVLWLSLYLVTVVSMAGVGYQVALAKSRRSLVIVVLVLSFSTIMTLVADLDRPRGDVFTVGQQALIDLRGAMGALP